jgi:hypothetical protein
MDLPIIETLLPYYGLIESVVLDLEMYSNVVPVDTNIVSHYR